MTRLLVILAFLAAPNALAESPSAPMEMGGLHRAAATLDLTLDVYRLALVELVVAAERVEEAGDEADATPVTPLPRPAAEVFARLANSVGNRVPIDALPAVVRAYHAEVIESLQQLAAADTLGEVLPPLKDLARSMGKVGDAADQVVDLFSRKRPLELRIIDPTSVLDDIGEALDEVAAAERAINRLREREATLGDQLHAFMRLEVSLGHALDLIAVAQDAGIEIGFTVQLSTIDFAQLLRRVRSQLDQLAGVITRLEELPPPVTALSARLLAPGERSAAEVRLLWTLSGHALPSALRIYRRVDLQGTTAQVEAAFRCEGKSAEAAAQAARAALKEVSDRPVRVAELAGGRRSHAEGLRELPVAPPLYRVVAVTPFGVEGNSPEVAAAYTPAVLQGVRWLEAQAVAPRNDSSAFYTDYDAVDVRWGLSRSDPRTSGESLAAVTALRLPLVAEYQVVRLEEGQQRIVASLAAGLDHFRDHVSPDVLAAGVRYRVDAVGSDGRSAAAGEACAATPPVRVDMRPALALARAGVAQVEHPTALERATRQHLANPATLAQVRDDFVKRSSVERERFLRTWWQSLSTPRRVSVLRRLPSEAPRLEAKARTLLDPRARDRDWAMAEAYLSEQPVEVRAEVDRWWDLLSGEARARAVDAWRRTLNSEHRRWVDGQVDGGGAAELALRPARVLTWWQSRDPLERREADRWWNGLDAQEQGRLLGNWFSSLPDIVQRAVRFPEWEQLTSAEQRTLLDEGYRELPEGRWAEALGYLPWYDLERAGGEPLLEAVRSEAGVVGSLLSNLRYALRPLDRALGFRLSGLIALLFIAGLLFLARWRSGRDAQEFRPLAAADAVDQAIGWATETGRAVVFVPGTHDVNDVQTLAGLSLLDNVAERAARSETELLVATSTPLAHFVARDLVERACVRAGRPDLFTPDVVRYVAAEPLPLAASVAGLAARMRPAASLIAGSFSAESLIVAESGHQSGAFQIAGSAETSELPFLHAASDRTLIGEELFAVGPYLAKEPRSRSALRASDWVKLAILATLALGVLLETFGVTAWTDLLSVAGGWK